MLRAKFTALGLFHGRPSIHPLPLRSISRKSSSHRHKIRMMILSDTYGDDLEGISLPRADVVLHCADLINRSQHAEIKRTVEMLRAIDAPLKLFVPGNHDFRLEPGYRRWTKATNDPNWLQQGDENIANAQKDQTEDEAEADVRAS
ncbi:hypothetical protein AAL_08127 [Moelleriella libera RCEF 2490]|uniref:Calcineurin-like phosphoesterase domain-containing protein n=1 Tax=Moelleriella libera RCEF 2490 TaxID=1081109 RepID=A0A167W3Q6_9HYPO|nr:hypothetical protein AAL_08127 [Moelleriella libera RCEF 2490]